MDKIKIILVPVDFSANSAKILKMAADLAKREDAKLHVIHVAERFDSYTGLSIPHISFDVLEKELQESSARKLDGFIDDSVDESIPHESTVLSGDAADEIVKFGEKIGSDLIVMGTHGYKGLEKVLLGSVAERVVSAAYSPVMTINPYRLK